MSTSLPRPHWLLGHAGLLRRDPLGLLRAAARDGDLVPLRIGRQRWLLVRDPGDIERVLADPQLTKPAAIGVAGRLLFGGALTALDGEPWSRRRRPVAAGFHRAAASLRGPRLAEVTAAAVAAWQPGERAIAGDVGALVMAILGDILLGDGGGGVALVDAMALALDGYHRRVMLGVPVPDWLPVAGNREMRRGMAVIRAHVARALVERRRTPGGDLASQLLAIGDEPGAGLDATAIGDELSVMLALGGHQTAAALGWTLGLLAGHPDQADAVAAAGSGRDAAARVVDEALRLWPPFYLLLRQVTAPLALGDRTLAAGTTVVISPWLAHRDPRSFDEPDAFRPARWAAARPRRGAYLPFGAGPRACIAQAVTRELLIAVVAAITGRFHLALAGDARLEPRPRVALGLAGDLPVVLRERERAARRAS